ncbi:hypothetical protein [Methylobacterium oryzisoli]|uniref:hypothetical protein n=1 Tax=Methylobacterium oryzisoli TaxID=3385502 RepID=UPI003891DC33
MLDWTAPPGQNYEAAEFRFWSPPRRRSIRYVLVLSTGINADGRPMVGDAAWRTFATQVGAVLIGVRFVNKKGSGLSDAYTQARHGSGKALLDAIGVFAARARRPEMVRAPLLLWGFSAGGQFNYGFVAWKPEQVAAFVVNKGGIYPDEALPATARQVPGLFFLGNKDAEWRQVAIRRLLALNAPSNWILVEEPVGHEEGESKRIGETFFRRIVTEQ